MSKITIRRNNGAIQYKYSVVGTDGHVIENYSTFVFAWLRKIREQPHDQL